MLKEKINYRLLIKAIPIFGICCFIILYFISALMYPGGNYLDRTEKGFSILHNYWCDLLNKRAGNGLSNPSSPVAITATCILCTCLMLFWYHAPQVFAANKFLKRTIQVSGMISMVIAIFIFTEYHAEAITYSGMFGGIAFLALLISLYSSRSYKLFVFGILCLLLGVITFTIYKTREFIIILPFIQKVTLLFCLLWIARIDHIYRKRSREVHN